jgi:NAD(P)-dependent dehydrogenase (short-subunit alcohol dehydrogenase family)
VVANSRNITRANPFPASARLALVDGDIADPSTAAKIREVAVSQFGRIDALINKRGHQYSEDFTDCKDDWKEFVKTYQPMGQIAEVKDVVDAVVYLTGATKVTGEVLHVDGGAHVGKW